VLVAASPSRASFLRSRLGPHGIDVVAHRHVERLAEEKLVDVIVFDGGDLVDATATARRLTAARIVVLGDDERAATASLAVGADAWLPSNVSSTLLAVQLQALLRRPAPAAQSRSQYAAGQLTLDVDARRAAIAGRELQLAPREFELLKVLIAHEGEALSRDRILEAAWGARFIGEPKTVDVHVAWLRAKLERSGVRITTLRGVGYRLDVLTDPDGDRPTGRRVDTMGAVATG
jgi:DNA-binding response OmpR family regulator